MSPGARASASSSAASSISPLRIGRRDRSSRGISMSTLATRFNVAAVAAKGWPEKPRNGFTATKCFNGHSGAICPQAFVIASSISCLSRVVERPDGFRAKLHVSVHVWVLPGRIRARRASAPGPDSEHGAIGERVEVEPLREMDVDGLPEGRGRMPGHDALEQDHRAEGDDDRREPAQGPRGPRNGAAAGRLDAKSHSTAACNVKKTTATIADIASALPST